MQNSNPSHHHSPVSPEPSIGADALARAYERARARMLGGEPRPGDLRAAFSARGDEHADPKIRPHGQAAPPRATSEAPDSERPDAGERVTLDELLPVFREPIDWALARAERRAQGDPVDLATIHRVRAAYQSRLVALGTGGALGDARAKVRLPDLLTVAGLLVGSIDPGFVQRASASARESLLDALAAVIPLGLDHTPGDVGAQHPAATLWLLGEIPDAPAPFGSPRPARHAAPSCCCGHHHVR